MNKITIYFSAILIMCLTVSCDKSGRKAEIPAYIQIDSLTLGIEEGQGTATQKITDVWVNMDGNRIGTYSLPAKFPVIAEGEHTIKIWAGVLKNGITDYRERYAFFEPNEYTIDLIPNKVHQITPTIHYYNEDVVDFWIEDFDEPGLKFHSNDSINLLQQISINENSENKVGYIQMPDTTDYFNFYTDRKMQLSSRPIYMELEYKSTVTFGIGIKVQKQNGGFRYDNPFTYINPKDEWNKLYINLNEQFNISNNLAKAFDIYFVIPRNKKIEKSELYLDNIKILSFK